MNVLEKILEEIGATERIRFSRYTELLIAVKDVEKIIRSYMDETEKVSSAEIVSHEIDGKPYYEIKYKKVEGGEYYIGYGSYDLKNVVKWLNECFEFCGEAKVSVIDGKDTNVPSNEGWIPVEERLPENSANSIYDMQLVTLKDGEVCLGVYRNKDGEWWTRKQEGETHYKNKHEVIAWQPRPEPYKED